MTVHRREQEDWLARDRAEIAEQIEHGFAQAERGQLIDGHEVRDLLRLRRATRQNKHQAGKDLSHG